MGSLASSTLNVHLPATSNAVAFSLARTGANASATDGYVLKLAASDWSPPALSTAPLWAKANTCPAETANSRGMFMGGIAIDPTTGKNAIIGSLIGATDFGDGTTVSRTNGLFFLRRAP